MQSNQQKIESQEILENQVKRTLLIGTSQQVCGICICQQRNLLAIGYNSENYCVKLWNLKDDCLIQIFECLYRRMPEGNQLVFANSDGKDHQVKLIDISDLKTPKICQLLGHIETITRLTFTNNSKHLISGSEDSTIRIWDCQSQTQIFQLNQSSEVADVTVSADDTMIASNSIDGNIRIWNFLTQKLMCTQPQNVIQGYGIQFSNNQQQLVSGCSNGVIQLWYLAIKDQCTLTLIKKIKIGNYGIKTVLFSPCSRYIITMGALAGQIKVYDTLTEFLKELLPNQEKRNFGLYYGLAITNNMEIIAYPDGKHIVVLIMK